MRIQRAQSPSRPRLEAIRLGNKTETLANRSPKETDVSSCASSRFGCCLAERAASRNLERSKPS